MLYEQEHNLNAFYTAYVNMSELSTPSDLKYIDLNCYNIFKDIEMISDITEWD